MKKHDIKGTIGIIGVIVLIASLLGLFAVMLIAASKPLHSEWFETVAGACAVGVIIGFGGWAYGCME